MPTPFYSSLASKREAYAREAYFREAQADVSDCLGPSHEKRLSRVAALLIRPDGVAARRVEDIVSRVVENGFRPAAVRKVRLDRLAVREIWRYELNAATVDRIYTAERIMTAYESLYILVQDMSEPDEPACARLRSFKGPADPTLRARTHLRTLIGARSGLLSYVHSADEPADLLRELGILFGRDERRRLLSSLCKPQLVDEQIRAITRQLYARCPAHSLSLDDALSAIRAACNGSNDVARQELWTICGYVAAGEKLSDIFRLFESARSLGIPDDDWNLLVLASHAVVFSIDDVTPDIKLGRGTDA